MMAILTMTLEMTKLLLIPGDDDYVMMAVASHIIVMLVRAVTIWSQLT